MVGLENQDLVFWLINSNSEDFAIIKTLVKDNVRIIKDEDKAYASLKNIMVSKINKSSIGIQKEIEIISQTGAVSKKYKPFDLEKAKKHIALVGKQGEELVNEYLEGLKSAKELDHFEWMNKSRESGLPYDFILYGTSDMQQYVDVKSTKFDFSQSIVFSNQEVEFANQFSAETNYSVYRVFDMSDSSANLKICSQCMPYMKKMNSNIQKLNAAIIESKTKLLDLNIAVSPIDCFSKIQESIKL